MKINVSLCKEIDLEAYAEKLTSDWSTFIKEASALGNWLDGNSMLVSYDSKLLMQAFARFRKLRPLPKYKTLYRCIPVSFAPVNTYATLKLNANVKLKASIGSISSWAHTKQAALDFVWVASSSPRPPIKGCTSWKFIVVSADVGQYALSSYEHISKILSDLINTKYMKQPSKIEARKQLIATVGKPVFEGEDPQAEVMCKLPSGDTLVKIVAKLEPTVIT